MNRQPAITAGVALLVIVVGGWFTYRTLTDRGGTSDMPTHYFYTVDEGKTLFAVSAEEVPPVIKDGKEAVRTHVFSCDNGRSTFVGYLEKYHSDFKKKADAAKSQPGGVARLLKGVDVPFSLLVKKPGDKDWSAVTSPAGQDARYVKPCPSGKLEDMTERYP